MTFIIILHKKNDKNQKQLLTFLLQFLMLEKIILT